MKQKPGSNTLKRTCPHHWLIDDAELGKCKLCGEIRDFGRLSQQKTDEPRTIWGRRYRTS